MVQSCPECGLTLRHTTKCPIKDTFELPPIAVPTKAPRRKWDFEEAKKLREEDPRHWTFNRLGQKYGVSHQAINRNFQREEAKKAEVA